METIIHRAKGLERIRVALPEGVKLKRGQLRVFPEYEPDLSRLAPLASKWLGIPHRVLVIYAALMHCLVVSGGQAGAALKVQADINLYRALRDCGASRFRAALAWLIATVRVRP